MFHFMRGVALVAATLLGCGASFAEDDLWSANYMMPACRAFVASNLDAFTLRQGRCIGIVETLGQFTADVCGPSNVTTEQAIRVVVKYIDDRPARMHENFSLLAREALRAAWPCSNK